MHANEFEHLCCDYASMREDKCGRTAGVRIKSLNLLVAFDVRMIRIHQHTPGVRTSVYGAYRYSTVRACMVHTCTVRACAVLVRSCAVRS